MSKGRITSAGTNGFWFAEDVETRESIFVHISQVERHLYLHVDDEIEYTRAVNPKSGKEWATEIKLIYAAPMPERKVRP